MCAIGLYQSYGRFTPPSHLEKRISIWIKFPETNFFVVFKGRVRRNPYLADKLGMSDLGTAKPIGRTFRRRCGPRARLRIGHAANPIVAIYRNRIARPRTVKSSPTPAFSRSPNIPHRVDFLRRYQRSGNSRGIEFAPKKIGAEKRKNWERAATARNCPITGNREIPSRFLVVSRG